MASTLKPTIVTTEDGSETATTAMVLPPRKFSSVIEAEPHIHEIGFPPADSVQESRVRIPPSQKPIEVVFSSRVVTASSTRLSSPEYLASLRRRKAAQIAATVDGLATHAADSVFAVWTEKPFNDLRQLIQTLSDGEEFSEPQSEGNSCEILRQVRDTFLNGGWERYIDAGTRNTVVAILRRLAEAVEVTAADAERACDQLLEIGLDPGAVPLGILCDHASEEVSD